MKVLTIFFDGDYPTSDDMVGTIEHIKKLIAEEYTSGYYPNWDLKEIPNAQKENVGHYQYRADGGNARKSS